jgi:hypothetical protein
MSLISKETLLTHLQRAEMASDVRLPIEFFRDLVYQAMPRTWVNLTDEQFLEAARLAEAGNYLVAFQRIQQWIKEGNT